MTALVNHFIAIQNPGVMFTATRKSWFITKIVPNAFLSNGNFYV